MPQIIASYCHPSQTAASAKVWSGKTLVGTSASVAATARAGLWEFTFASNVPVGWYDIEVFQSTGVAVSNYPVYSDGSSAAIAHNGAAELDSATQAQIATIIDGIGWTLASLYGACANPQTADALVQLTINGYTYSGQYSGMNSSGVRTAPTLSKV